MSQLIISHRGNLDGPIPSEENKPSYIEAAMEAGYHVEVDVWVVNGDWFLGHDEPQYQIDKGFLNDKRLWCHAKNLEAFEELILEELHCFWHQEDNYTLTSKSFIWAYPGQPGGRFAITVMPDKDTDVSSFHGVCTDYPNDY